MAFFAGNIGTTFLTPANLECKLCKVVRLFVCNMLISLLQFLHTVIEKAILLACFRALLHAFSHVRVFVGGVLGRLKLNYLEKFD